MDSMRKITGRYGRAAWRWPALALVGVLAAAGCNGQGASKAGGVPEAAPHGTITLSFASADQLPVDTTFATLVAKDSGGHLKLHTSYYNGRSTSVDVRLAAALAAGKLDVADVASRAWESQGIEAFRAYQVPFLVTSRSLRGCSTHNLGRRQELEDPRQPDQRPAAAGQVHRPSGRGQQGPAREQIECCGNPGPSGPDGPHLDGGPAMAATRIAARTATCIPTPQSQYRRYSFSRWLSGVIRCRGADGAETAEAAGRGRRSG
jgi:hypothetical protein